MRQKLKPRANWGTALALGGAAYDVYSYRKERPEKGWGEALLYGAAKYALWAYAMPVALAWSLKDVAFTAGELIGRLAYTEVRPPGYRDGLGRGVLDNAAKATMRQRAVQALQESRTRANFALGTEARRISRGYFEL